jgi:hypothetical protein
VLHAQLQQLQLDRPQLSSSVCPHSLHLLLRALLRSPQLRIVVRLLIRELVLQLPCTGCVLTDGCLCGGGCGLRFTRGRLRRSQRCLLLRQCPAKARKVKAPLVMSWQPWMNVHGSWWSV